MNNGVSESDSATSYITKNPSDETALLNVCNGDVEGSKQASGENSCGWGPRKVVIAVVGGCLFVGATFAAIYLGTQSGDSGNMLEAVLSDRNVTGLNVTSSSSGNSMLSPLIQSGQPGNSMLTPSLRNHEKEADADVKTVSSTASTPVTTTTEKTSSTAKVVNEQKEGAGRDASQSDIVGQNNFSQSKKNSSKVGEVESMENIDKPADEDENMMQGDDPNAYSGISDGQLSATETKTDVQQWYRKMVFTKDKPKLLFTYHAESHVHNYEPTRVGTVRVVAELTTMGRSLNRRAEDFNGMSLTLISTEGNRTILSKDIGIDYALNREVDNSKHCAPVGSNGVLSCDFNFQLDKDQQHGDWRLVLDDPKKNGCLEYVSAWFPTGTYNSDEFPTHRVRTNKEANCIKITPVSNYIVAPYFAKGEVTVDVTLGGFDSVDSDELSTFKLALITPDNQHISLYDGSDTEKDSFTREQNDSDLIFHFTKTLDGSARDGKWSLFGADSTGRMITVKGWTLSLNAQGTEV